MVDHPHLEVARELVVRINEGYSAHLEELASKYPPASQATNRASEMGHPCLRYLVLLRTQGEKARPHGPGLHAIFEDGRLHEEEVKRILSRIGIQLIGAQRSFPPNAYNLTGHVDIGYEVMSGGRHVVVGIEVKSINGYHYNAVREPEDMLGIPLLRRWYCQAQAYMVLSDTPVWVFVFKNKATGQVKALPPAEIDWGVAEEVVDRAARVNDHVAAGTLPVFCADFSVCLNCRFRGTACFPVEDHRGMAVLRDEGLARLADQVAGSAEVARTHDRARAALREALEPFFPDDGERTLAVGQAIVVVARKKGRATMTVKALPGGEKGGSSEEFEGARQDDRRSGDPL